MTNCSLPPELTIYTIGELYPHCLRWVEQQAEDQPCLHVDAQAVLEVDAAGVQLLLSLSNTLNAQQRWLQLVSPSESLSAACVALGASCLTNNVALKGPQP